MDQDAEMRKMADQLQHFLGHEHPLLLNEDNTTTQSHNECAGCGGEILLGPSFSCVECRFYLHKKCAEVPLQIIDHPFHLQHPLLLLQKEDEAVTCRLCSKEGKGFLYHCSACEIYFHINCALLPRDTAGNFIQKIHSAHQQHPLFLIGIDKNQLPKHYYSCCSTSLPDSASYACFECRIFFHKTCLELPAQIDHPFHRKHKLILDYERKWHHCNLSGGHHEGFSYCCSPCKVEIDPAFASLPPVFKYKDKSHPHPFTLFFSPPDDSYKCDACGNKGNNVSFICSTCHIRVHMDCVSKPLYIKLNLHPHPISRCFSLCVDLNDSRVWDCRICYKTVDIEHGSYSCSLPDCDFVIHVECAGAAENELTYGIVEVENPDEFKEPDWLTDKSFDSIIRVIKEINVGDEVIATEIVHFSHQEHSMNLSEETADDKCCNGCLLPVLSSYYYCSSNCNFILHKACAEFRRKARLWFRDCPFNLLTDDIFLCSYCSNIGNGFSFRFVDGNGDGDSMCLRCASLPHSFKYQANETHYLFYNDKFDGKCNACGERVQSRDVYRCKDCTFGVHMKCVTFPRVASHKCDQHSLRLAFQDKDDYSPRHYCDICEETRDTQQWFYECKTCDKAAHRRCALGKYPFIKAGNYTYEDHPLTFAKNIYYYPKCIKCGEPCKDLALECRDIGCNYIVHWNCIPEFSDFLTWIENSSV